MSAARTVNLWLALSTQALDEFKTYRQDENNYSGPMTQRIYRGLSKMQDFGTVQRLFSTPTIGGREYNLFSMYFNLDREQASVVQDFLDELTTDWPNQFIIVGAWWWDGRQVGTQWELDQDGDRTGNTTGTPVYAIPTQAYRIMPDVVTYDENGNETSRTPASSNADLRDINLLSGQSPRRFVA